METVKVKTSKWAGFIMTMILYIGAQILTDVASWLSTIGEEGFVNRTPYQEIVFLVNLGLGMFITLRALVNSSFGKATNSLPLPNGKITLE
jgi:hypothetical protein